MRMTYEMLHFGSSSGLSLQSSKSAKISREKSSASVLTLLDSSNHCMFWFDWDKGNKVGLFRKLQKTKGEIRVDATVLTVTAFSR